MKKLLSGLLALAVCCTFAACAASPTEMETMHRNGARRSDTQDYSAEQTEINEGTPSPESAASQSPSASAEATRTARPLATRPATSPSTAEAVNTAGPTASPAAIRTAKPTTSAKATKTARPTATAKATKTAKPAQTAKATKTAKPTVTPKATKTARPTTASKATKTPKPTARPVFSYDDIPAYSGMAYVAVNDNVPFFTDSEKENPPAEASLGPKPRRTNAVRSYEYYTELDDLGRCGPAIACISTDIMPTEKRGDISEVRPSGWRQKMYDFVDGEALYNRCHLLGYQLTAENANAENLITGTRYMNTQGMLPFENMVADYIKETGNHVLYRVTPVFVGDELLARGVLMEAQSVEDNGEGVEYCVFAYNVQPGVQIDYSTGKNREASNSRTSVTKNTEHYILNTKTMKYHEPSCKSVLEMSPSSRKDYRGSLAELEAQGFEPCSICTPAA